MDTDDEKREVSVLFQTLLDELQEQHNFTTARRARGVNYLDFASGIPNIRYYAKFQQERVYTALHIHFSDYEKNKNFFDVLEERKAVINAKFDVTVYWNRRDDINTCIIGVERDGDIESDTRTLESIRAWHVENLLKFKEVFTPEIQRAHETLQSR